ncbi:MAG: gliding motility protein GldL [Bacteroidetes bacterium]|nr:gliding motility protein GldL [Bacteroidota bacterium]
MAKLYGIGASVVILGALFKINHYMGADYMLIVGLGTESIIFFFSAFEPPHVEPDWSLVYPQLAGIYHETDQVFGPDGQRSASGTQELDKMLEKAKIGPELIESLGLGLRTLTETTSKLSDVSNAALANDQFVNTMKTATDSVSVLNESYKKSAKSLDQNVIVSEEHLQHIQAVSKSASTLSHAYAQASETLKDEISLNKEFSNSLINATMTTNKFVEKYHESSELLSKTSEALHASVQEENNYNKQLQKISSNLSALNSLYELHLQSSNLQMESTGKVSETMNKLTAKLNESLEKTNEFKQEVENFSKNIAALNKVYGNMLSAMNIGNK